MRFPADDNLPSSALSVRNSGGEMQFEADGGVRALQQELARITSECADAAGSGRPGELFILLRKKWRVMQRLYQAQNELNLRARNVACAGARKYG